MGKIMKIKMKIILLVGSFIILCLSSYCICAIIKNFQKLKTREQTKNLWQEGEQPNYEKGKKSEDRVYEGYWELPFSEMVYAQENTVEILLNEYKDISFEYRFPVGECKYKNYFLGLLKNDINFHEIFEEKEVYIPQRKDLTVLLAELEDIKNTIDDIKARQWHLAKLMKFHNGRLAPQ